MSVVTSLKQRIVLQIRGQDAFGDHEQPRVAVNWRSKRMCQPISRPTVQPRSSAMRLRHRARRHPPRLQQQHPSAIDERRRHARRLAGAWRGASARPRDGDRARRGCRRARNQQAGPAARSIIRAYRQGYSPIHGELRNTLEPDPVHTGGGRAEMSKSTPVPTANTFAEAFPNSTKVFDDTFVDTPAAASTARAGSRGRVERRRKARSPV